MGTVVVAPDKFKGSLTAREVAEAVTGGLLAARPDLQVVLAPVADGGDGTLDAALAAGFERRSVSVTGPTGEPVSSAYGLRDRVAVVELASASGLVLLPGGLLAPLTASSRGTGELIAAALDNGCTQIVLAVGGSACTDGGAGMLQALGGHVLDAEDRELGPGGAELARLERVDLSTLHPALARASIVLASDVDNPLLGTLGAAAVYGPQKGASPQDVRTLDAALARFAELVDRSGADVAGAGAAGGVGYAALSVFGATMRAGIEVVLELVGFADQLVGAELVVTGEGALDRQTLHGKAPAGVAAAARAVGVRVVAVCGRCELDAATLAAAGITRAYALVDIEPDVQRCLTTPTPLLRRLGEQIAVEELAAIGG